MKKYLLIIIGCLALLSASVSSAHAAITFDASSTQQKKSGTTATSTITVGAGSNEILLICISLPSGKTVSSVKVGATSATKAVEIKQGAAQTASLWYLKNVSAGTATVSSTLSGSVTSTIGLSSYFGVDQTNLIEATSSSSASSGSTASSSITTLTANDVVVDCLSNASGATLTAGSGQTVVAKQVSTVPLEGSSYKTFSTPQVASTSWTLASSQGWALAQAALRPAGVVPDATSITTTVGGDGARSGDSITITGTNFGTVSTAGNRATCGGGPGTGCIQFVTGGNDTVPSANISAWTDTSITFTVPATLNSNGGASAVQIAAATATDTTPLTFYIYPRISAVASLGTNAARTYSGGDTDGLIMLSGDHFGTTNGTSSILGYLATLYNLGSGPCTIGGFTSSTACFEVPTSIPTSTYTGNIVLTRASDGKQASTTANSFSILPRILTVNPMSTSIGNVVQILGDHLCQSGTCPVSPNRSSGTNNVIFGTAAAIAFVQSTSTAPKVAGYASKAFRQNVGAGDLLVVGTFNDIGAIVTATDTLGDTFTPVATVNAAGDHDSWVLIATTTTSGADTITVSVNTGDVYSFSMSEYSGTAIDNVTDIVDASSTNNAHSASLSTGNITTSAANDLVYAYFSTGDDNANATFTYSGAYTQRELGIGVTGFCSALFQVANCVAGEDAIISSAGTTNATATISKGADAWGGIGVAFKINGSGGSMSADSDFVNQTGGAGACNGGGAAWADGEVCVKVPAAAATGTAPITLTSNGITSNSASFTVTLAIPGTPGTPTYTSVNSSTLTVNWSSASGIPSYYKIERATSSQVYVQIATTTATSSADSGLSANTTYYYRVRATNSSGDSPYSASSSVLTVPDAPGMPMFTSVSTSTLTVNWAAPGGGTVYYKVERALDSGGSPGTFSQIPTLTATTSATLFGDSGLAPSVTYWYRVRATNATGNGAYSGNASTTTIGTGNYPPNAPSENAPANNAQGISTLPIFQVTATDPNSDNVQYRVVLYSNSSCTATSTTYDESSSQTGWSGQNATSNSSNDSYLSGTQGTYTAQSALLAGTKYYWKASAKDPKGTNTWGSVGSCNNFTTSYGTWTADSGNWTISGNQLTVTPASGAYAQLHVTAISSQANGVIEFQGESSGVGANTGKIGGIVHADSGANHYYLTAGDFLNQQTAIAKSVSSVYTALMTAPLLFSPNIPYEFRGYIFGSTLKSWVGGANALTTSDSSLGSGYVGLAASSTNGTATFAFDDFAFYSSPIVTLNNLPAGGSWSILNHSGIQITVSGVSCWTGSTIDLSTYAGQVPIDYDNGGGQVAVWTSNNTCSGAASLTYPSSGYTNIFGGDTYSYGNSSSTVVTGSGTPLATSSVNVSSVGSVSY